MVKRGFDVTFACIGLIILAPILAIIAVLVKLDSPGPAFFKGERIGQFGKKFHIFKFRSMIFNAPQMGAAITYKDDPRITRIGRFLRHTKLDELPSLVNVLRGEMSFVGPRPEAAEWVARYTPEQQAVLSVKPGITGLSQIRYRNEEKLLSSTHLETDYSQIMNNKLEIDLEYVKRCSFILDIWIILQTLVVLLKRSEVIYEGDLFTIQEFYQAQRGILLDRSELLNQYVRRIALDFLIIPFAFYLAWLIRFDIHVPAKEWRALTIRMGFVILVYVVINFNFGIYRRLWAFASFSDIILLSETVGLATLVLVVVNLALTPYLDHRISTGGLIIGGLLVLTLSVIAKYRRQLTVMFLALWVRPTGPPRERALIIGVNETAQQLVSQMYLGKARMNYDLVGFIDENPNGMNLNGVEILGGLDQLQSVARDKKVDVIIIARWPPNREEMWQLISRCLETPAQVKVLPNMADVINGGYRDPLTLRDVKVEDILGRDSVEIDVESCGRFLSDKVVLVTGAAGSIGSELCRQILEFGPQLLLALDNNETGLYELNLELESDNSSSLQLVLADVADWHKMKAVYQQYKPQVIFHAAAYKHVPMLEECPDQALRVNVVGTMIVSDLAHKYGAESFVLISTDKAVNPVALMGASKRIGELWIRSLSEYSDTTFAAVRFGNVVGSRGSVLPTFARQIDLGGPVKVTHPDMTRFFMSIPEAVSLVLQATTFSRGRDVFMLEMGEEISILDLARRMIRLKGLRVHKDIEIKFTGARPGEKLREELSYLEEEKDETPHPSIYRLRNHNELADDQLLLGAVLTLNHLVRLTNEQQIIQEGIFHIASCEFDAFLDKVTGLDFSPAQRQLNEGARTKQRMDKERTPSLFPERQSLAVS